MLLIHRRDIIEPVEIGHRLQIGLGLDQLLGAAMQKADMRIDALNDLAVQFEDQPENTVSSRVLRAEINAKLRILCSVIAQNLVPAPKRKVS